MALLDLSKFASAGKTSTTLQSAKAVDVSPYYKEIQKLGSSIGNAGQVVGAMMAREEEDKKNTQIGDASLIARKKYEELKIKASDNTNSDGMVSVKDNGDILEILPVNTTDINDKSITRMYYKDALSFGWDRFSKDSKSSIVSDYHEDFDKSNFEYKASNEIKALGAERDLSFTATINEVSKSANDLEKIKYDKAGEVVDVNQYIDSYTEARSAKSAKWLKQFGPNAVDKILPVLDKAQFKGVSGLVESNFDNVKTQSQLEMVRKQAQDITGLALVSQYKRRYGENFLLTDIAMRKKLVKDISNDKYNSLPEEFKVIADTIAQIDSKGDSALTKELLKNPELASQVKFLNSTAPLDNIDVGQVDSFLNKLKSKERLASDKVSELNKARLNAISKRGHAAFSSDGSQIYPEQVEMDLREMKSVSADVADNTKTLAEYVDNAATFVTKRSTPRDAQAISQATNNIVDSIIGTASKLGIPFDPVALKSLDKSNASKRSSDQITSIEADKKLANTSPASYIDNFYHQISDINDKNINALKAIKTPADSNKLNNTVNDTFSAFNEMFEGTDHNSYDMNNEDNISAYSKLIKTTLDKIKLDSNNNNFVPAIAYLGKIAETNVPLATGLIKKMGLKEGTVSSFFTALPLMPSTDKAAKLNNLLSLIKESKMTGRSTTLKQSDYIEMSTDANKAVSNLLAPLSSYSKPVKLTMKNAASKLVTDLAAAMVATGKVNVGKAVDEAVKELFDEGSTNSDYLKLLGVNASPKMIKNAEYLKSDIMKKISTGEIKLSPEGILTPEERMSGREELTDSQLTSQIMNKIEDIQFHNAGSPNGNIYLTAKLRDDKNTKYSKTHPTFIKLQVYGKGKNTSSSLEFTLDYLDNYVKENDSNIFDWLINSFKDSSSVKSGGSTW